MSLAHRVLLPPRWLDSDAPHRQSRWQALHGHIDGASGLGDWPAGIALLRTLLSRVG